MINTTNLSVEPDQAQMRSVGWEALEQWGDDVALDIAAQASAAWEAAVCWDDEYAVKRLAEVRAV